MSNRTGFIGLLFLSIAFAFLLAQFILSALQIRQLVQPLNPGGAEQPPSRRIVLISQELDNPFWRAVEQGAREASSAYGMELDYTGPFRIHAEEQIKLLQKAVASKADAIILQGIGDPAYRQWIDRAVDQGIPVIAVDTDEPDSKRLAYVGTDNLEAGRRMGELVIRSATGKPAQIGVLVGSDAENQQQRLEGFRAAISRSPELQLAEVKSSHISRLQAARQAEDMLTRLPQLSVMVGLSALDGIGIREAAARAKRPDVRIFAFDDLEETVEGIRQCAIAASLVQQPAEMGRTAVSLLRDYFGGQRPAPQHFTVTSVLDRSTLGAGTAGAVCR